MPMPIIACAISGRNLAWRRAARLRAAGDAAALSASTCAQLLLLFVVSALIDIGRRLGARDPDAIFSLLGLVGEVFFGALLMLFAALLALRVPAAATTRWRCR